MKKSGTYRIDIAHWSYFGSSVDLSSRRRNHRLELDKGIHANEVMQRAFNKYKVFEFTILEECNPSEILAKEQVLLDLHYRTKGNMNLCPMAANSLGYRHTPETCRRMSERQVGRKPTPETRRRLSESRRGEKNNRSKLSDSQREVLALKKNRGARTVDLCREFSISKSQVKRIHNAYLSQTGGIGVKSS